MPIRKKINHKDQITSSSHGTMQGAWNKCLQGNCRTVSDNTKSSQHIEHCNLESKMEHKISIILNIQLIIN